MKMTVNTTIDGVRTSRMKMALDTWKQAKGIGTLNHCPGFGKTNEGIMAIRSCINSHNYTLSPYTSFLVIVPSAILVPMWQKEINDNFPQQANKIYVRTIDSIDDELIDWLSFYLIVFDEIHKYLSDMHFDKIAKINHVFRLGLSGSIPSTLHKYYNRLQSFCPVIDTITESEGIANNWVSKYTEYNIALILGDADRINYLKYSTKLSEILNKYKRDYQKFSANGAESVFDGDLNLIMSCIAGKKIKDVYVKGGVIRNQIAKIHNWHRDLNLYIEEERFINDNYHPDVIFSDSKVLQNMVHLRSDILNNNIIKINACLEVHNIGLGKTIIFNESVDMADKLGSIIDKSIVFHSYIKAQPLIDPNTGVYYRMKTKDEVKLFGKTALKGIIPDMIQTEHLDTIITARALDEGFNAPCIQTVITTAGTVNFNQHKQRSARAKRIDFDNPDKKVVIINLFFDDFTLPDGTNVPSRDKEKLISRQQYVNTRPIWCKNIEEFKTLLTQQISK